jgi:transcription-repair coupling factor (superfamily II helicase)
VLSEIARKRLAAIREFSDLGAGFRIAALDLELRGAGNLLGGEQSGHIQAVGLDLYVKLLEQSILELRGQPPSEAPRATLHLGLEMRIPESYVSETHQRLGLYKRLSEVRSPSEIEALRAEIRDRFGPLPAEVEGLLVYAALRPRAERAKVSQVDVAGGRLVVRFSPEFPLDSLPALVRAVPGAALTPQAMHVPLPTGGDAVAGLDSLLTRLEEGL